MKYLVAASSIGLSASFVLAAPAAAQSTGSVEFEENVIVVTGAVDRGVGGVEIPETPKAKQVLEQEIIRRQRPGQTVNDIVNLVPGVSFQNNDPWGSGGGSFTIRGFGSDRVSQTLDGIPLNDSGNYALYTNQQVDSEVLEEVNVNLGVTDIDSPTASASGGTINIRTRRPSDTMGVTGTASYGNVLAEGAGDRPYYRVFGMVDTGDITGMGTTAFFSGSYTTYENPFNNYGEVEKKQFNGRIFQEIGGNGDFVSVAGHYNENRNNFFGSFSLDALQELIDAGDKEARFYEIDYPCTLPAATPGVADSYSDSSSSGDCGSEFDRRYNPSNTGNIRGSSRFTLADNLVLTVDPTYQYVKANGGGAEDLREGFFDIDGTPYTGFLSGGYYYGRDLNGDGDMLDRVGGTDPSQTRTHRYTVISSLAYEINDQHRVRLAYTWDRADHRQTGETALLQQDGEPMDVFPVDDPLETADGFVLNKRDRQSYAILHQVSGEYRGSYLNDDLTVVLGLRAPFFTRDLEQNCYTTTASGFIDCLGNQDTAAYEAANPDAAPPQERTYKYDDILPSAGFTYNFTPDASVFANYAKGISVPGTDPLYDSFYIPNVEEARPVPETTDTFDLGLRYQTGNIQAQVAGWFTKYENRLATAYDPELDEYLYRNLGQVDKYGIDASIAWRPTVNTLLYVFGSINESEIKEDVVGGVCELDDGEVQNVEYGCTVANIGEDFYLPTAGNRESGSPDFTVGARGQVSFGGFELGAQVKNTGKRFSNDLNTDTTGAYTLVDLDLRYTFAESPLGGDMAVQLNVSNLFDEFYVGGFSGSLDGSPFVQIGPPRAASISLIVGY
jgi:iron complex outermembrane receptor protein